MSITLTRTLVLSMSDQDLMFLETVSLGSQMLRERWNVWLHSSFFGCAKILSRFLTVTQSEGVKSHCQVDLHSHRCFFGEACEDGWSRVLRLQYPVRISRKFTDAKRTTLPGAALSW